MAFNNVRLLLKKIVSKKEEPKPLEFKEIGWKITLPEKFNQLNDEEAAAFVNDAQGILVKPVLETGEALASKILFAAQLEQVNSFTCLMAAVPGNTSEESLAQLKQSAVKKIVDFYTAIHGKKPGVTVKTVADCMVISKLEFDSIDITVSSGERILLQASSYFKIHNGYYINILAAFKDDEVGKEMFHALLESKFKE